MVSFFVFGAVKVVSMTNSNAAPPIISAIKEMLVAASNKKKDTVYYYRLQSYTIQKNHGYGLDLQGFRDVIRKFDLLDDDILASFV